MLAHIGTQNIATERLLLRRFKIKNEVKEIEFD